ncbi:hypothetical protein CDL15_Pgr001601 [Punica granatum]|uniref:NADP-dependent oxidoreductase domain-containing protein n=1 Tax=Punica granatum TaxID=22663 RepID=A0A218XAP1_PUNGR|nr:hypothetical protein CDL15_Pgr001601 [Punica granatum]
MQYTRSLLFRWSGLWTREIEELGIGIVAYCPIVHGFFGGKAIKESIPANSILVHATRQLKIGQSETASYLKPDPPVFRFRKRFHGLKQRTWTRTKIFYSRVEKLAEKRGCSPAQLALAWILRQGNDVVHIPGTSKIKNLESNIGSLRLKLTEEDLEGGC